ncbi:hypothetical protein [Mucilaginibacter pedocola]|uniref:Uncharacterized protein n=1 Tax=Mucilaginibacter pedocola TaxID=1792845 RepID=A0A1S9PDF1_9SPHI|nr:hypothetical protein [Mucilaginibacter pedocola]OOQ58993.1 hypothetical protein BC343_29980 [Mucilaginibacter pedocola]
MRPLKRGEIKQILIDTAAELTPEFSFVTYKNSCYFFERLRRVEDVPVHEFFQIVFSLKDGCFCCSVASRLNVELMADSSYNTGLLNPHLDLIVLKKGTGALPLSEAYYYHDGNIETVLIAVEQIFYDFKHHGISFLDNQFQKLQQNHIIKTSLHFLRSRENNRARVGNVAVREELEKELKEKLYAVPGQTREDRKKINRTTRELIELYLASPSQV